MILCTLSVLSHNNIFINYLLADNHVVCEMFRKSETFCWGLVTVVFNFMCSVVDILSNLIL